MYGTVLYSLKRFLRITQPAKNRKFWGHAQIENLASQRIAIAENSLRFKTQSVKSQVLQQKNRRKIAEEIADKIAAKFGARKPSQRFRI